MILKGDF